MANTSWVQLLNNPGAGANWTGVAGTALASSTTETIISPTAPDFTFNLHAPSLYVGQVIRVMAQGEFSNTGTPTLRLRLCYGGTSAGGGVVLLDTTALTTYTAASHDIWSLTAYITCRSAGASGTVMPLGMLNGVVTNKNTQTPLSTTGSTTPAVATIDTTAAKSLVLSALWGTSSASNTLTCHQWNIEGLA